MAVSFRDGTCNPAAQRTAPILRSVDCGPKHGDPPKHADRTNGGPSGNPFKQSAPGEAYPGTAFPFDNRLYFVGLPGISNNVGPVKTFLSALLRSLRRVVLCSATLTLSRHESYRLDAT
jgi:hypothetical protein